MAVPDIVETQPDRPDLTPFLTPVWEAFSILSKQRAVSLTGPEPIPVSEITSYSRDFELEQFDLADFVGWVVKLDEAWCDEMRERLRRNGGRGSRTTGRA